MERKRVVCDKSQLVELGVILKVTESGEYEVYRGNRRIHSKKIAGRAKHCKPLIYNRFDFYTGRVNGKPQWVRVYEHALVWLWFNDHIPEGFQIDHIDNNSTNNHISNLQLLTPQQNIRKSKLSKKNK